MMRHYAPHGGWRLGRPVVAAFDSGDSLRADAESGCDVLALLTAGKRLSYQSVAFVERGEPSFPLGVAGEDTLGDRLLDVQVWDCPAAEIGGVASVADSEYVTATPVFLELLGSDVAVTESRSDTFQHLPLTVGEDDVDTLALGSEIALAIGEAGDVGGERFIGPTGEVHTASYGWGVTGNGSAIAVPVAQWLGERIVAYEAGELDAEGTA